MNTKLYRMRELLNPTNGRSLVLDTSGGLVFGALPGLEHFREAVQPLLPLLDGIVTSPGQVRNLGTRSREAAALLVRADWTNALRSEDFVLPPETIQYLPLLGPTEAHDLGASALVMDFVLGHEEAIEAQCLKRVVDLSLEGLTLGMPLVVAVQPIGPRVVLREKAIELGVSYALEGGADGIAIPWPGPDSFKDIRTMTEGVPVWIKPESLGPESPELDLVLEAGAAGFWLDARLFAQEDPLTLVQDLAARVHNREEV